MLAKMSNGPGVLVISGLQARYRLGFRGCGRWLLAPVWPLLVAVALLAGQPQVSAAAVRTSAAISAGTNHTCAVTSAGPVECWGYNAHGELGDGTTTERLIASDVSGLSSGVVAISAGASHTCALTSAGAVKCWGYNGYGQLGDGTTTNRLTAVEVSGLSSGVVAISAAGSHACALTSAGAVTCWGDNAYGELGDGTTTNRSVPVAVSGLSSGVVAISAGYQHTCALTSAGAAKCWGFNAHGELGDGTTTNR